MAKVHRTPAAEAWKSGSALMCFCAEVKCGSSRVRICEGIVVFLFFAGVVEDSWGDALGIVVGRVSSLVEAEVACFRLLARGYDTRAL